MHPTDDPGHVATPDYAYGVAFPENSDVMVRTCVCGHVIWRRPRDFQWKHSFLFGQDERTTKGA
jgi:hypothetical protein